MYKANFLDRPACVILNKSDLDRKIDEKREILQNFTKYKCFSVSAKHGVGLGPVILHCRQLLQEIQAKEKLPPAAAEKKSL